MTHQFRVTLTSTLGASPMNVIVFGPTGGTGKCLVDAALHASHRVTAFARATLSIAARQNLSVVVGSVHDAAAVTAAMQGQDAVLSALGGRPWRRTPICAPAMRNIAAAMTQHGVRRIVAISTNGAGETRAHVGWFVRNVVFRFILDGEVADKEAMERVLEVSDLDWTVVRIGMLSDGAGTGLWRAADDGTICEMGKIARADVAAFMVRELASDAWLRRKPVLVVR